MRSLELAQPRAPRMPPSALGARRASVGDACGLCELRAREVARSAHSEAKTDASVPVSSGLAWRFRVALALAMMARSSGVGMH